MLTASAWTRVRPLPRGVKRVTLTHGTAEQSRSSDSTTAVAGHYAQIVTSHTSDPERRKPRRGELPITLKVWQALDEKLARGEISLRDLANDVGTSPTAISDIRNGKRHNAKQRLVERLADYLGVARPTVTDAAVWVMPAGLASAFPGRRERDAVELLVERFLAGRMGGDVG